MRPDKNLAIRLRKRGLSYNQISKKLSVPKSTLSGWLCKVELTKTAKERILKRANRKSYEGLIRRNKKQTLLAQQRADSIKDSAKKEVCQMISNPIFLIGLSLYWAEGYKRGAYGSKWKCVDFTNSDPRMIEAIVRFYTECCGVKRNDIKAQLIAHENLNIQKCLNYWVGITGIPKENFIKTCCSVSKGRREKKQLTYGTVHIRIYDVRVFYRIIGWLEGLADHLKSNNNAGIV